MKNIFWKHLGAFSFAILIALAASGSLRGQDTPDTVLKPPKGSQVAIVVFEDLECPMCKRTAPLLEQASRQYKIPLIQHDFPLGPMHPWSFQAAVMARYFDTKSKAMGNDFRDYCFEHQLEINVTNLRGFAEKFAADHKTDFPFVIDPNGKLAGLVNADHDLGKAIKLDHTPTVYIVSNNPNRPFVEVKDNSQLYTTIDAVMKEAPAAPAAAPTSHAKTKTTAKSQPNAKPKTTAKSQATAKPKTTVTSQTTASSTPPATR